MNNNDSETKLIAALRVAADALENDTIKYVWRSANKCNCDILVSALLEMSNAELLDVLERNHWHLLGTWKNAVNYYCPMTGIPKNELFKQLYACGLTGKDMIELENLSNKAILRKAGLQPQFHKFLWWKWKLEADFDDKQNVIKYFRAWADILQEKNASMGGSFTKFVDERGGIMCKITGESCNPNSAN